MITNAPCKDCSERHIGCHSECEKYKSFREFKMIQYEKKIKEQSIEGYVADSIIKYARNKHTKRRN